MQLSDEKYEAILNVIYPFAMGELEEVTSFDDKTDAQREEIMKVSMKSLEVGVTLMSKFVKEEDSLNLSLVNELLGLIKENKLAEAAELLNKE